MKSERDYIMRSRKRKASHRSPFAVHRSPFTVRRSPFTVRRSPFAVRRSPFAGAVTVPASKSKALFDNAKKNSDSGKSSLRPVFVQWAQISSSKQIS
jgi:hypothetical protein